MAANDAISFELVSPERLEISEDVEMVTVPGAEGQFGVLARHAPLISSLRPGVIGICRSGREPDERYFVASGFAEVTGERCTVLAEHPEKVDELDRAAVEKALENARVDYNDAKDEKERDAAAWRVQVNDARLRAITG
ncbi:ATP synthase F1 subcomplex epsilon subunit [Limimonas halophila]|uniref:ATP synthase epsilon chain n=1 Tax=Limimonas halophila TaxID=1082479 RepID=A0A1G7UHN1_9PROT|nr:ATP synthase F1 subunit epsilon [Limimonas halophila]SDG46579.1 ATP synthase F1 subcomplex epsilon subunit [Limimonas halophila]